MSQDLVMPVGNLMTNGLQPKALRLPRYRNAGVFFSSCSSLYLIELALHSTPMWHQNLTSVDTIHDSGTAV